MTSSVFLFPVVQSHDFGNLVFKNQVFQRQLLILRSNKWGLPDKGLSECTLMRQKVIREIVRVDENHQVHINIPLDMGDEIENIDVHPYTCGKYWPER